jgi:hypothetical protein
MKIAEQLVLLHLYDISLFFRMLALQVDYLP